MRLRFLKLKNWLLVTLMGALGFSGCKTVKDTTEPEKESPRLPRQRSEIRVMYGVPTMNYMVRGQVHNKKGEPLGNISINMLEPNMHTAGDSLLGDPELVRRYLENTEIRTDADGQFTINVNGGQPQEQVRILVRDVDGKDNGAYSNKIVKIAVTPENLDRSDANSWHQGTLRQDLDIELSE